MKINKLMQLLRDNAQNHADGAPVIRLDASGSDAHIYVYDVIDPLWGASAGALIKALAEAGDKPVQMHINSPGGDVFESIAMQAAISSHTQPVHAHVEGMAASAATGLALACASVSMTDGSLFMIHNSWTLGYGNKTELRDIANLLEKIDIGIANTYVQRTGQKMAQVQQWMDAETWFTAAEAKAAGFVQNVSATSQQARAKAWDLSAYSNAPKPEDPPLPDPAALQAQAERQLQVNRMRLRALSPI